MNNKTFTDKKLYLLSSLVSILFWSLSSFRHFLLQSNGYDLGLFDQWIWLASRDLPQYSSMSGIHLLADHGAWLLYIPVLFYKIFPSIHWLFLSQSIALSFTIIPLSKLCKELNLSEKKIWLITILWLLQPIVFNVNLFDFHPEVWIIPLIVYSYLASYKSKYGRWMILNFIILGARDGLVLLILGMGIEQFLRKRYLWSLSAITVASLWLYFLNNILYPSLNLNEEGILAIGNYFSVLGNSLDEIIINFFTKPMLVFSLIDLEGSIFYLFILCLPFIFFWKRSSLITLSASLPLLTVNIISDSFSLKTLIHHYSLPIAILGTIAAIEGIKRKDYSLNGFRLNIIWISLCWTLLAKPTFFLGPYLSRINIISEVNEAISLISNNSKVLTTSYIVPHLTKRKVINWAKSKDEELENYDVLLLNPNDPGWQSTQEIQNYHIENSIYKGWKCQVWESSLHLCMKPNKYSN